MKSWPTLFITFPVFFSLIFPLPALAQIFERPVRITMTPSPPSNSYRRNSYKSLSITLSNVGPTVKGTLLISFLNEERRIPVTLSPESTKRFHTIIGTGDRYIGEIEARYVSNEETVARTTISLNPDYSNDPVILDISENPMRIDPAVANQIRSQLSGRSGGVGVPLHRWVLEDLPRNWLEYSEVQVIAVDSTPLSTLDPDQLDALDLWIHQGGTLLVHGAMEVFDPIVQDLIPVEVAGTLETDQLTYVDRLRKVAASAPGFPSSFGPTGMPFRPPGRGPPGRSPGRPGLAPTPSPSEEAEPSSAPDSPVYRVSRASPKPEGAETRLDLPDATYVVDSIDPFGDVPIFVAVPRGLGRIVYFGLSLSDGGFVDEEAALAQFWTEFLGEHTSWSPNASYYGRQSMEPQSGIFRQLLSRTDLTRGAIKWIMVLLGLYAVVQGPAVYFYLARTKRKQWAVVTTPVIALVFVAILYLSAHAARGNVPHFNRWTYLEAFTDANKAISKTYVGIQSAHRTKFELEIDAPHPAVREIQSFREGDLVRRREDIPLRIENLSFNLWERRYFEVVTSVPKPLLLFQRHEDDSAIAASVENRSEADYDHCFVYVGGASVDLGPLEAGETLVIPNISLSQIRADNARVHLGWGGVEGYPTFPPGMMNNYADLMRAGYSLFIAVSKETSAPVRLNRSNVVTEDGTLLAYYY